MSRVTVAGTGFGALTAIRKLRAANPSLDITVVGKQPELIYYPSLIWVPSGMRDGNDVRIPLDGFFRRMGVRFHQGAATDLSDGGRTLVTDTGTVENDGLILATGGRYITKLPGIEHAAIPCRSVEDAERVRDRLREMDSGTLAFGFSGNPKEPSAMRGGPVFEFMFGTETWLRRTGRRERFRIVFFSPAARPGQRLGEKAVERILSAVAKRGIDTHLGHKLLGFEAGRVKTEGGDLDADLIVFVPGMTGSPWMEGTKLPRSPGGMLQADAMCRVPDYERVYAAGDCASFPGPDWMPKQAHMADLQGEAAARNLMAELAGRQPTKRFKVELACILDSLDSGTLVMRTENRSLMIPPNPLLHVAKRFFEWYYVRQYR